MSGDIDPNEAELFMCDKVMMPCGYRENPLNLLPNEYSVVNVGKQRQVWSKDGVSQFYGFLPYWKIEGNRICCQVEPFEDQQGKG